MHDNVTIIIILIAIVSITLLTVALLLASIVRRGWHSRMHRQLDALRKTYRDEVRQAIASGEEIATSEKKFRFKPGSLAWQAVEEVLQELMAEKGQTGDVEALFRRLGYVEFYENRLSRRNVLIKASAIDKLGKMGCLLSTSRLVPLLDTNDPEILSVTVRALSNLRSKEGLAAIIERLPTLLGKSLVTRKAMETALLKFGGEAIPFLTDYREDPNDPWILSCILEMLSILPPDPRSLSLAIKYLGSTHPEVRSKALKVIGSDGYAIPSHASDLVLPLLNDPVWFVRLQAVKSVHELTRESTAKLLEKLLFDENWRVRSEAALALTRIGSYAVDVFYDALKTKDVYAKESICEEIEKTRFSDWLIKHLDDDDKTLRAKCHEILRLMHVLGFSMPLTAYVEAGENERIKQAVRHLLASGVER
ncbi:MAG TPA: HEAT repeat domain-containing protein [Nitrospirota bacterium]|nr:HEAT repeat domain-containing protein [Nitrospirota bacterium]